MRKFNALTLAEGATHVATFNNGRKNAFTLAEVLITLGIIGVVAAMTMPTLVNQTNGAEYKAAFTKALSAISQGVTLNVALDGDSFDLAKDANAIVEILGNNMNIIKGTEKPQKVGYENATLTNMTDSEENRTLFFNDGIVFQFSKDAKECTKPTPCYGFIDVNGLKGPNKEVKCSDGKTGTENCAINMPTDIYPVKFYGQTIEPNSWAARAVLSGNVSRN